MRTSCTAALAVALGVALCQVAFAAARDLDAGDSPEYSRYAVVGRSNWPRPNKPQLKETVYFKQGRRADRMRIRDKYLSYNATRIASLGSLLRSADRRLPLVVMVLNWGQAHLFFNWLCGINASGWTSVLKNTVVFAADDQTHAEVGKHLPCYRVSDAEISKLPAGAAKVFGDAAFGKMMMVKLGALYTAVVELGFDVLYQDVDVVWNHNPLQLFYKTAFKRSDVLFSYDGNIRQPPFYANAGFFFVRSTPPGKEFVQDWLYWWCLKGSSAVQGVMNTVLMHHYIVNDLAFEVLPTSVVPHPHDVRLRKGGTLGKELDGQSPLVVHAAWTYNHWDKVKKLNAVERWWFNDKCSLYSPIKHLFSANMRDCMENLQCEAWKDTPARGL